MSGVTQDTQQFIYIRLLALITGDLNRQFEDLNRCLESLQRIQNKNEEHDTFISKLSIYMNSSQLAVRNLKEWTEFQILGPKVYSSNLRFQTHIVIQIIKSNKQEDIIINNDVYDKKHVCIDLTLFGFILRKLLLFILDHCNGSIQLKINSEIRESDVIICISGIHKISLKQLGESILKREVNRVQCNTSEADAELKLCYDILSFYGGNLWSEMSEQLYAKLCFSIPWNKI